MLRLPSEFETVLDIAFHYSNSRISRVRDRKLKLAHYTTASNAMKIINGGELWLRNASVMNDFLEIKHGTSLLNHCLADDERRKRFGFVLDSAYNGLADKVLNRLKRNEAVAEHWTFMTSLSEHAASNDLGRLSMWRAYGGPVSGVALIFDSEAIFRDDFSLSVVASPVLYGGSRKFEQEFDLFCERLGQGAGALRKLDMQTCSDVITRALQFSILSCKHPGFAEEREWRLIHRPQEGEGSAWIIDAVEDIRGVPQVVYKVPLVERPGMDQPDLNLNNLLYKVLIGPTLYPHEVRQGFIDLLIHQGFAPDWAASKVVISDIPLRQWG